MNMVRHLRNCQSNVEKRQEYEKRLKAEETQKQREMLISDFGKMTLDQAEDQIKEIKSTKIRDELQEIIKNKRTMRYGHSSNRKFNSILLFKK